MPGQVYNYSADQVDVIFAGVSLPEGLADGDFAKVTPNNDIYTYKQGTDGSGTRSKRLGQNAKIELTFSQGSPSNAILSAILNADYATANGAGVAAVLIKDRNGTTVFAGAAAWLVGFPEVSYSRESSEYTWTIEVADLKSFVGGL